MAVTKQTPIIKKKGFLARTKTSNKIKPIKE